MRTKDDRGNAALGCLIIVFIFLFIGGCVAAVSGGGDDCYATPGAQSGSAQAERDIQRCIGGGPIEFTIEDSR